MLLQQSYNRDVKTDSFLTPLAMLIQLPELPEYFPLSFKCPTTHSP